MVVHPLSAESLEAVVELGADLHAESAYRFLPYERDKVRRLLARCIANPDEYHVSVVSASGVAAGFICGYVTTYFFCSEKLACDLTLFVAQPYRGSPAAASLVEEFRRWAAARGARELCLGISTGVAEERAARLYERMGLVRVGSIYKQRLHAGVAAPRGAE